MDDKYTQLRNRIILLTFKQSHIEKSGKPALIKIPDSKRTNELEVSFRRTGLLNKHKKNFLKKKLIMMKKNT